MNKILLTCSALAIVLSMGATQARSQVKSGETMTKTTTTETMVNSKDIPGSLAVDFSAFDINQDGIYSMSEVGERLFKSFDRDNNGLIDKNEWKMKTIITIIPMEKQTLQSIDYNNDGIADKTVYTHETFYKASGLNKFDLNNNGLSAAEFIGEDFNKIDLNNDNFIDIKEWKNSYLKSLPIIPEHNKPSNYNE